MLRRCHLGVEVPSPLTLSLTGASGRLAACERGARERAHAATVMGTGRRQRAADSRALVGHIDGEPKGRIRRDGRARRGARVEDAQVGVGELAVGEALHRHDSSSCNGM